MRLFSFYPQTSDVGETQSLVPDTVRTNFLPSVACYPYFSAIWRGSVINIYHHQVPYSLKIFPFSNTKTFEKNVRLYIFKIEVVTLLCFKSQHKAYRKLKPAIYGVAVTFYRLLGRDSSVDFHTLIFITTPYW
jgi:hypothetical protein